LGLEGVATVTKPLREYQVDAIDRVRLLMRQGKQRVVLVLPTGGGKTRTGGELAIRAVSKGLGVLWLAHRSELISQSAAALRELVASPSIVGIIAASSDEEPNLNAPIVVASVQTLLARNLRPRADLIIADEAHHFAADTFSALLAAYPDARVVGLTATPQRGDGRALSDVFDGIVVGATVAQLTELGHLVPAEQISHERPLKGVDLAPNLPVEQYKLRANGTQAILFARDVEQAEIFAKAFNDAGIPAGCVRGDGDWSERESMIERFKSNELRVLSNVYVLTEGFDCLDSETEILTACGWRSIDQISTPDTVPALNRETGKLEPVSVQWVGARVTRPGEKMVSIRSQHADIRTTAGHNFFAKYRDPGRKGALSSSWLTLTGAQLVKRKSAYALPLSAEGTHAGINLSDDEIRLVAWFMTDGGFENGRFAIAQSKPETTAEIRALLERSGLHFTSRVRSNARATYPSNKPCTVFYVPKGTGRGSKKRNGYAARLLPYLDKNVSKLLHGMTRAQFRIFWEEALKGDGSNYADKRKSQWLWCDRKSQVDAYSEMAVVRGHAVSFAEQKTKAGKIVYRISVRDRQWLTSDPSDPRAGKLALSKPLDGERVWCIQNRLGTIITRRKGKVVIVGNCPPTATCILARGFGSASTYLQCIGRVLRPAPGKTKALVLDLYGVGKELGEAADERIFSLDGDGIRLRDTVSYCEVCGVLRDPGQDCAECGWSAAGSKQPRDVIYQLKMAKLQRTLSEAEDARIWRLAYWMQTTAANSAKKIAKGGPPISPNQPIRIFESHYKCSPTPDMIRIAQLRAARKGAA
jgi:superfamily II DNA or RNA helicase